MRHNNLDLQYIIWYNDLKKFISMHALLVITTLPSDYDLVSHTTHVLCVQFVYKWRNLQFEVESRLQILFTLILFASNVLRECRRGNIFTFNKSAHHCASSQYAEN